MKDVYLEGADETMVAVGQLKAAYAILESDFNTGDVDESQDNENVLVIIRAFRAAIEAKHKALAK